MKSNILLRFTRGSKRKAFNDPSRKNRQVYKSETRVILLPKLPELAKWVRKIERGSGSRRIFNQRFIEAFIPRRHQWLLNSKALATFYTGKLVYGKYTLDRNFTNETTQQVSRILNTVIAVHNYIGRGKRNLQQRTSSLKEIQTENPDAITVRHAFLLTIESIEAYCELVELAAREELQVRKNK